MLLGIVGKVMNVIVRWLAVSVFVLRLVQRGPIPLYSSSASVVYKRQLILRIFSNSSCYFSISGVFTSSNPWPPYLHDRTAGRFSNSVLGVVVVFLIWF